MVLQRLNWQKYLFVDRTEAQTEQAYWNGKRKRHLASEHSSGIAAGLGVTETGPPSLQVDVASGRALGSDGTDPEVESPQTVDLAGLVPGSGSATVYITLAFADVEVEPYFVEEAGLYQNKYVRDAYVLAAGTTPPADPAVELARVELAAGATEITNSLDPLNPGPNEIDFTHRHYSGKEVLNLEELSDVSPDEAAAFNGMTAPSATNPIGTLADIESSVAPVRSEVEAARGSSLSLDARLDAALAEDGSLKGHAATHQGDGTDPVASATASVAGLMSAADKSKLGGVEAGAVAAGAAGDAHAAVVTGNPHALDSTDVGAAPASHVGAGGSAHAAATTTVAGFMSAADKVKLDELEGGGTWKLLDPTEGSLVSQLAGMQDGDRYWLKPGVFTLGGLLTVNKRILVAGAEGCTIQFLTAADKIEFVGTSFDTVFQDLELQVYTAGTENCYVRIYGGPTTWRRCSLSCYSSANKRQAAIRIDQGNFFAEDCAFSRCATEGLIEFASTGVIVKSEFRRCSFRIGVDDSTVQHCIRDASDVTTVRSEVKVIDCSFELGSSSRSNKTGMSVHGDWRIQGNTFKGFNGVNYGIDDAYSKYDTVIDGNVFNGLEAAVVLRHDTWRMRITRNLFSSNGSVTSRGFDLGGGSSSDPATKEDILIAGNVFYYFRLFAIGINVYGPTPYGNVDNILIRGNVIYGSGDGHGIELIQASAAYTFTDIAVVANAIRGVNTGIRLLATTAPYGHLIANNKVRADENCIQAQLGLVDAYAVISGNSCIGNVAGCTGIVCEANYCAITGNAAHRNIQSGKGVDLVTSTYCSVVSNVINGATGLANTGVEHAANIGA